MKVIDKGKNPAKVKFEDNTVKSSKEAKKEGIETIVNYGDENYGAAPETYDECYTEEGYYEEPYYDEGAEDVVYEDNSGDGGDEYVEDDGGGEEYYEE
jgi:hypothetical protein